MLYDARGRDNTTRSPLCHPALPTLTLVSVEVHTSDVVWTVV